MVSGAPGTGKSTVAAALGAALRFPVLSLDPVKEALADVLGLGGEDWSNQVGDAAAEVVFRLAAAFPDAVAEGPPWAERRGPEPGQPGRFGCVDNQVHQSSRHCPAALPHQLAHHQCSPP